jgi:hypothetical protein
MNAPGGRSGRFQAPTDTESAKWTSDRGRAWPAEVAGRRRARDLTSVKAGVEATTWAGAAPPVRNMQYNAPSRIRWCRARRVEGGDGDPQ